MIRKRATIRQLGPRTGLASRIATALVALALCAAAGEAAIRLLWKDRLFLFPRFHAEAQYGDFTIRRLVPNARYWHTSVDGAWEFRINAQGYRDDRDWSYAKPPGRVRVLVLGDSQTQGFEALQHDLYSAVLERALRARGFDAEVLNTGVSGFGTAEELAFLENEGFRYAPDAVVLGWFANDVEDNLKAGLFALQDGALVTRKTEHVPGVGVLRALDAIPGVPWLSQNSYLYSLAMNTAWETGKKIVLARARARAQAAQAPEPVADTEYAVPTQARVGDAEAQLAIALAQRMHEACRTRAIPLVVLDLPQPAVLFPPADAPLDARLAIASSVPDALASALPAASDAFVSADAIAGAWRGVAEIHRPHGQRHFTEIGHLAAGLAAAEAVERVLRPPPPDQPAPPRFDAVPPSESK